MLAEFSVAPLDKGGKKLSEYVAPLIRIIEESGLEYQLATSLTNCNRVNLIKVSIY